MPKKPDILPVDRDTWKLMQYDSLYYVPNKPYDEYDFLKTLSMKKGKFPQNKIFVSTTDEEVKKQDGK